MTLGRWRHVTVVVISGLGERCPSSFFKFASSEIRQRAISVAAKIALVGLHGHHSGHHVEMRAVCPHFVRDVSTDSVSDDSSRLRRDAAT